jgi:hypothetical protein
MERRTDLRKLRRDVGHDSVAFRVGRNVGIVVTRDMAHFVLNRCHTPYSPNAQRSMSMYPTMYVKIEGRDAEFKQKKEYCL